MLTKDIHQITKADIDELILDQREESKTLEFKRELNFNDSAKRELACDIASFANASGGDLLFGVDEQRDAEGKRLGYAGKANGISCQNFDELRQRLENFLRDAIEPPIPGLAFQEVAGFEDGSVVIVRIPESWIAPHLVKYGNKPQFYARNTGGKFALDSHEIRAAFLANDGRAKQLLDFCDRRVGLITAAELPAKIDTDDRIKIATHVLPVLRRTERTLSASQMVSTDLSVPMRSGVGWNHRFNLDGYLAYDGLSYSLLFRSGGTEAVFTTPTLTMENVSAFYGSRVEQGVIDSTIICLKAIRKCEIPGPYSVHVALVNTKGTRIVQHKDYFPREPHTIDRSVVILPQLLLEEPVGNINIPEFLKPAFDVLWQASGWQSSPSYDDQGKWTGRNN